MELGGRKVHYSHAYYPRELFYGAIYDGASYTELRKARIALRWSPVMIAVAQRVSPWRKRET